MRRRESVLDPLAMARARRLLATPVRRERSWPPLAAAAFAAAGALILAGAVILLPPHKTSPSAEREERVG